MTPVVLLAPQVIAGLEALLAQAVKRSAEPGALLHGIQQLKAAIQRRWAEDGLAAVAHEPRMRGDGEPAGGGTANALRDLQVCLVEFFVL